MGMLLKKLKISLHPTRSSHELRNIPVNSGKFTQFYRHDRDCGSTEVQIARQTVRISELTEHLKRNKHDHATKRGLTMIIGKRLGLLRYLIQKDRQKYLLVCDKLGIKKLAN